MAEFAIGDRVETVRAHSSTAGLIPKGSYATVRAVKVRPFGSVAVWLDWDGPYRHMWIDVRFLEKR